MQGEPYQSTKASPPKIIVKNSEGSSAVLSAAEHQTRIPNIHTKSATWHSTFLAIFIVCCSQLVIAEYLIGFTDLLHRELASFSNSLETDLLELGMRCLITRVLVCTTLTLALQQITLRVTCRDAV